MENPFTLSLENLPIVWMGFQCTINPLKKGNNR